MLHIDFISSVKLLFLIPNYIPHRNTLYKAVQDGLPHPGILKVAEAYKDFAANAAPLITTMSISADAPMVDSLFGPVQEGSPISYQYPVPVSREIRMHSDAPPPPSLPLDGYRLAPTSCQHDSTPEEKRHLRLICTYVCMVAP